MDNLLNKLINKHLSHSVSSLPLAFSGCMFGMSSMDSMAQEADVHLH